ncbi:MAG: hypothetical protein IKN68_03720 [Spirochaetia bacterium]|nr:hypothetical protein [Spirochaetia bacterium]
MLRYPYRGSGTGAISRVDGSGKILPRPDMASSCPVHEGYNTKTGSPQQGGYGTNPESLTANYATKIRYYPDKCKRHDL